MAKQEGDMSIVMEPLNIQSSHAAGNVHQEENLEKLPSLPSLQPGVHRADVLRKSWTKTGLIIVFIGLFLCTLAINFADYSTQVYAPYTTSAFKQHSAMSAARVVMNIARISAYPIIAKLGDVFGRAEMFILSILMSVLGYAIWAACTNITQYIVAGIFDAIGSTGFALTQQIFVADMTSLVDRGIWSTLPDSLTTIPTLYLGTIVAQRVLDHSTWRWGWGMWAIILPVASLPLIGTMLFYQRRTPYPVSVSEALGWRTSDAWWKKAYRLFWIELDLPGAILLVAGLSLLLVPLSLTGSNNSGAWTNGSFIAMLVLGVVAGIFAAFFMKYTKRSQIWVLIGVPLCVLGMGVLLYLVDLRDGRSGNEASFVAAKSLIGIGRGFYQTAAQVSVQAVVSRQDVSVVTAVFFASMSVGGAIGTSVAGAIWRNTLPKKLQKYLPSELKGQAKSIFGSIVVARNYAMGTEARDAINRSYRESQRLLAIAGLASLSLMLIVMLFLKNVKLSEEGMTEAEIEQDQAHGAAEKRAD
ncbi:Siderophore iron transporter mirA [Penicillium digitatum PHI26]|uniref:Siderophore iron transporter mirA n=2 Tax=Penicillium digitatum TaxID=36651 RepID=K9GQ36_PEND2|nr:Siderophore iron transporter mirA [Penicillium digitatum Pd1]EKV09996.1 Siderophore iron transporter mirA [Penicillium digitatum Pd1]EKV15246.1 Siderophore iron transporter mirA [Penicillium digitatum PHI26]